MPATRNVTVAINRNLLKKARAIAAKRGLSVSELLADELRALIVEDAAYEAAQANAFALMDSAFSFGGARMKDRRALHERYRVC